MIGILINVHGCGSASSFTPIYNSAVNYALSQVYGHDRPVNHSASSARIHRDPVDPGARHLAGR